MIIHSCTYILTHQSRQGMYTHWPLSLYQPFAVNQHLVKKSLGVCIRSPCLTMFVQLYPPLMNQILYHCHNRHYDQPWFNYYPEPLVPTRSAANHEQQPLLLIASCCWLLLLIAGYCHGCWLFSKVYPDRCTFTSMAPARQTWMPGPRTAVPARCCGQATKHGDGTTNMEPTKKRDCMSIIHS